MNYTATFGKEVTLTNKNKSVEWHVKNPVRSDMFVHGGLVLLMELAHVHHIGSDVDLMNHLIIHQTTDTEFKLALPPADTDTDVCNNIFCAVANFFSSLAQWSFYIIAFLFWIFYFIGVIIVWTFVTTILFFTALFNLSLSGAFGPAGALVLVIMVVFVAFILLTVINFFKDIVAGANPL